MKALVLGLGVAVCVALGACGSDSSTDPGSVDTTTAPPDSARLDCGKGKAGSEHALRHFTAILRRGNRSKIWSVLIDRPRFFALSALGHPGPDVSVRGNPDAAARAVASHGGFPVRIRTFGNSEPPRRTTDFGFQGVWNDTRQVDGKAAIDCKLGKVIVFNVAVHRR
jgi:hypothetical protein